MKLSIADQGGDLKCKLPRDIQLWHDLLLGGPVQVRNGTDLMDQDLHGEMLEFKREGIGMSEHPEAEQSEDVKEVPGLTRDAKAAGLGGGCGSRFRCTIGGFDMVAGAFGDVSEEKCFYEFELFATLRCLRLLRCFGVGARRKICCSRSWHLANSQVAAVGMLWRVWRLQAFEYLGGVA